MAKAGNRFTIGPRLRRFPLTELREQERQERQQRRQLQQMLEQEMLKRSLAKPPPKQPQRRQAKPTQDRIRPKLRAKWPPQGNPPEGMSTSEVCRQAGIPDSQRRSVHRMLGREPKK